MAGIVRATLDWSLVVRKEDLPPRAVFELKHAFERPNPKFFKAQSMGFWTGGMKRTVTAWEEDERYLYLPRAAVEMVREAAEKAGLVFELEDETVDGEEASFELHGDLRGEQETAVGAARGQPRGAVLRGPCGCGKTITLLGYIARANRKAVVVVHNSALFGQWTDAVQRWLGFPPGTIGGGRKTDLGPPVVVAMQQTLARMARVGKPPPWTDRFGVVAGDEVHHWAATTFQAVARMFRARRFIGVSADERRKDGLEFLIEWTFGGLAHEIKRSDLESAGRLVPMRMLVVPTAYTDDLYLETVGNDESPDWVGMVSRMTDIRHTRALERAKIVWKVVQRIVKDVPGARVLVLNDRREACQVMREQFDLMGLRAGLLIGGMSDRGELRRSVAGLQAGSLDVGVGTTVADEGLDIPALTHVVLTSPVHTHPKRLEQMVGRAARPFEGKERATAVYIWDRLMFPAVPEDDVSRERLEERFLSRLRAVVPDLRVMEKVDFAGA